MTPSQFRRALVAAAVVVALIALVVALTPRKARPEPVLSQALVDGAMEGHSLDGKPDLFASLRTANSARGLADGQWVTAVDPLAQLATLDGPMSIQRPVRSC